MSKKDMIDGAIGGLLASAYDAVNRAVEMADVAARLDVKPAASKAALVDIRRNIGDITKQME